MTRTHAAALALVNWKGVFYERYLLDRHVTALEGANGAGKTTVMIAAYIVLLPDMSRLRFTNLGETGATGGDKGIAGRLGDTGRPSYAAIDFALADGRRLVAGVHLVREGELSVKPTPFIVSGLASDIRLQDLLLLVRGEVEAVPELPELQENAARLGGRLQAYHAEREYFATLFEQGVTPMRLGTDEERNKLNEMLRTSMTGGISRALTTELRQFVLKEEGGLADTLHRMKANLDACRRTRTEVQESRRLEHEIGGVLEVGQAMFAAAFLATRERADELRRRVAEAEATWTAAVDAKIAADDELERALGELRAVESRRDEAGQTLTSARDWHERVRGAIAAAAVLAESRTALEMAAIEVGSATDARSRAVDIRERRRDELRRAQDGYTLAARGLADLQLGIEELHRRAGAYRQVVRQLGEAETRLGVSPLGSVDFDAHLAASRASLADKDRERSEALVRIADADEHRRTYAAALASLRELVQRITPEDEAHQLATDALTRFRELRSLTARIPSIAADLEEARKLGTRQTRARARAAALGVVVVGESAAAVVQSHLDDADTARDRHVEAERAARSDTVEAEREVKQVEAHRHELTAREPEWREHDGRAARLAEHRGAAISSREGLDAVRAALAEQLATTRRGEEATREIQARLAAEARELLAAGGPFPAELLRLKDELGADLVAGAFEDVLLSNAGVLEAWLGPLAQALVVDDPVSVARMVGRRPETLPDVLLVPRDADLEALIAAADPVEEGSPDVIVDEGIALRVSRIPARPRLGRRAREVRAGQLRAEADMKAEELELLRAGRRHLERLAEDGEALLAGQAVWLAGDPAPALANVQRRLAELSASIAALRQRTARHGEAARAAAPRIADLRGLLAEAFLLDPPLYEERVSTLEAEHRSALAARGEVARAARFAEHVEANLAILRTRPLADVELADLRSRAEALRSDRIDLQAGIEALDYVHVHVEELEWSEAPQRLEDNAALVPGLRAQLDEAQATQSAAQATADQAEQDWVAATTSWQNADGRHHRAVQAHERAANHFESFGIASPTDDTARAAEEQVLRLEDALVALNDRRDALLTDSGRLQGACTDARARVQQTEEKLGTERREAEPAIMRWEHLRERALQHGLLSAAISEPGIGGIRGHVNLVQEARAKRDVLVERLGLARGGAALLTELEVLQDTSDATFADAHLDLWLAVRNWLRRRLPAQVAEVDDPREGLLRLRDRLAGLEEQLVGQEGSLRGASEDVALGIDVQIRTARGQVQRLTKNLEGVSFGSIRGIRVRLSPVERMEQVLRALRDGAAQRLLFQEDLPIEEALEEIFKRYGGGRTGGQRLLDYREYVQLQVEIRRKVGADWEVANPTRLSTGEAIGVGAALM